jgi:hypothetical protein
MTFKEKLAEILDYCAEMYYPQHEYGDIHKEQNKEYLEEATAKAIEAFNKIVPEFKSTSTNPPKVWEEHGFNQCVDQIERAINE